MTNPEPTPVDTVVQWLEDTLELVEKLPRERIAVALNKIADIMNVAYEAAHTLESHNEIAHENFGGRWKMLADFGVPEIVIEKALCSTASSFPWDRVLEMAPSLISMAIRAWGASARPVVDGGTIPDPDGETH